MLTPLDEHQLLVFWTQLLVLVAFARLFGELMRRVNLPSVIGQLGAGVVLGPSIFGKVWPDGFHWFLPDYEIQSGALYAVSWLGVALLLITAGFETDLGLIRRLGRATALVAGGSLLLPLVGGLITGLYLPDEFLGEEADRAGGVELRVGEGQVVDEGALHGAPGRDGQHRLARQQGPFATALVAGRGCPRVEATPPFLKAGPARGPRKRARQRHS